MADKVAFDTTFLIDLQRERHHGEADGPAHRFLAAAPDLELCLSSIVLGEFAEGFANELSRECVVSALRAPLPE